MKAYELLDSPDKWCQGSSAVTKEGLLTNWCDKAAIKRCAESAIMHCHRNWQEKLSLVRAKTGCYLIHRWNDAPERIWEEVYAVLKELDI